VVLKGGLVSVEGGANWFQETKTKRDPFGEEGPNWAPNLRKEKGGDFRGEGELLS